MSSPALRMLLQHGFEFDRWDERFDMVSHMKRMIAVIVIAGEPDYLPFDEWGGDALVKEFARDHIVDANFCLLQFENLVLGEQDESGKMIEVTDEQIVIRILRKNEVDVDDWYLELEDRLEVALDDIITDQPNIWYLESSWDLGMGAVTFDIADAELGLNWLLWALMSGALERVYRKAMDPVLEMAALRIQGKKMEPVDSLYLETIALTSPGNPFTSLRRLSITERTIASKDD